MARRRGRFAAGIAATLLMLAPAGAPAQDAEVPAPEKPSFWERLFGGTDKYPAPKPAVPGTGGDSTADPSEAPSLARAEWIGFTPVVVAGPAEEPGSWVAGPFRESAASSWVTDTVSGLTTAVRLVWRDPAPGEMARLSAEAAVELGLAPGAVVRVIYVAR